MFDFWLLPQVAELQMNRRSLNPPEDVGVYPALFGESAGGVWFWRAFGIGLVLFFFVGLVVASLRKALLKRHLLILGQLAGLP